MTSTPVVEVMRVSRAFGDLTVLTDVEFAVAPGEIHGLIGPNGVGKTTLLRIVAGLVDPSEGAVRVLGGEPTTDSVRTRIGWIPGGDRTFYLRLSGIDNLVFFGRMYGLTRGAATKRAFVLLHEVGLDHAGDRATGLYSKGMLKRLAVARALLPQPRLLLCDETTHDLDPDGAASIRALILDLAVSGTAVLWATQRLDELAGFADSVTVLSEGGVAFDGPMEELLVQLPRRSFRISTGLSDPSRVANALETLTGVEWSRDANDLVVHIPAGTNLGDVVTVLAQAGFPVTAVNEEGSTVEAAYRHVLGGSAS
ncbi:MAG: ABC transporter ATP-binding protein [Acidimicrobiia bacterium]